jgi:ABC-type cobalamin/Fe3+-siderophores transport system ATPase subunit
VFCEGPPAEVLKKEILEEVYGVKVKIFEDDEDGSLLVVPGQS